MKERERERRERERGERRRKSFLDSPDYYSGIIIRGRSKGLMQKRKKNRTLGRRERRKSERLSLRGKKKVKRERERVRRKVMNTKNCLKEQDRRRG